MILIADSGSFKTNWRILAGERDIIEFNTLGLNPFFTGKKEMQEEITAHFPRKVHFNEIRAVYFYGAGCGSPDKGKLVEEALQAIFPNALISVNTDLLAAARACFGRKRGIVVILGTGSNNGYYNGESIQHSFPSLGYILGDEGSGSQLGKRLITAFLLGDLPKELHDSFIQRYNLNRDEILDQLYSKPRPNRFLASFTPFLWYYRNDAYINEMVKTSFRELVNRHLLRYPEFKSEPVRCTGSVAHFFANELTSVIHETGGNVDCILQHPVEKLIEYHLLYN